MLFLLLVLFHLLNYSDLCSIEYLIVDPNHSFCSTAFPQVIDETMSLSEQEYILEVHNHQRQLTRGTNVEKMYWNEELAQIALRHARTCIFEHDKMRQRIVPRIPLATGQSLAMGFENWTEVLDHWIAEKEHYYHTFSSPNIFNRYTQMIWHSSALVGCASTICPPFGPSDTPWKFFICNYITGMLTSNYHSAYELGFEDRQLHDCQGRVCLYNGTLNLTTCECQCSSYATGSYCEKLNCSNLPPCPYSSSLSCLAVDVPLECPQLCGLCDRYEILKSIYGPENLSPDALAVKSSSHLFSFSNQMFVCCIIFILINKIPSQKQNKT